MTISYSLFKSKFKKSIVEAMYNEVVTKTARYYHWLGKENSWADFLSPFIPSSIDDIPGAPADNFRYDLHVRRDMLYAKAIRPADVSYIVPRYDWQSGIVYDMYDDAISPEEPAPSGATRLEEARFYVLTSEYNVYKCISNNYNSASTQVPSGTSMEVFAPGDGSDGYLWKFMYTIPLSLRSKFLTSEFMPVSTALKSQFYTNGEIVQIEIADGGSGYTEYVSGTGTITSGILSPQVVGVGTDFLTEVDVGYKIKNAAGLTVGIVKSIEDDTHLTLTTQALNVSTGTAYTIHATTASVTGDGFLENNPKVVTNVNFREVVNSGDFVVGTKYTILSVGSTDFTAIGASANTVGVVFTATGVGSGNGTVYQTLNTALNPGDGYTDGTYDVTFSDPEIASDRDHVATATATVEDGVVTSIEITDVGYGYETAPTATLEPPVSGGSLWVENTIYGLNSKVYWNGNYYNVSTAGQTGTTAPTHITGAVSNGTATLTYIGRQALLTVSVENSVIDVDLVISSGEIIQTVINNGGIAFSNATIDIEGPTGAGASLNPLLDIGNVDTLQANVEQLAVKGTIEYIKVVDSGAGYSTATITIKGDGTGATAEAIIADGEIVAINMLTRGSGYTWTDVVVTGNAGSGGAVVRAIMSPLNGHGYDAVDELNANSIVFYSSIARDILYGIEITNDYRKAGLLKNPKQFGSSNRLSSDVASGCLLITGAFNASLFEPDMLIQKLEPSPPNYKNYRIVDIVGDQILVSVFNNFTVSPSDVLVNENGDTISVTAVQEREFDQFSGELLFLTVREKYAPSTEQLVTLKTIVTL